MSMEDQVEVAEKHEPKPFSDAKRIMEFVYGGKAIFTLVNTEAGSRFTYQIKAGKPNPKYPNSLLHFVAVLSGPDNENDYSYFGYIKNNAFTYGGAKARIPEQAPSAKEFTRAFQNFVAGVVPVGLEFWHVGRCGRCGRTLTVPAPSGFGPECITKVGGIGQGQSPIVGTQQARRPISMHGGAHEVGTTQAPIVNQQARAAAATVRSQNPNEPSDADVNRMIAALQNFAPERFMMDGEIEDALHARKFWFKRFKQQPMPAAELVEMEARA